MEKINSHTKTQSPLANLGDIFGVGINQQIVLIILLIPLLAGAIFIGWPRPSQELSAVAQLSLSRLTRIATQEKKAEVKPPSEALIDPFLLRIAVSRVTAPTPGAINPAAPPEPKLEGIWIDSGRRVAFISGQAVVTGDRILGWTVTSILKDRVIVQKGSTAKTLRMEEK